MKVQKSDGMPKTDASEHYTAFVHQPNETSEAFGAKIAMPAAGAVVQVASKGSHVFALVGDFAMVVLALCGETSKEYYIY